MTLEEAKSEWLTVEEVAELLHCAVHTVYQWNSDGTGPQRYKFGKRVLYKLADVKAWMDTRAVEGNAS